MPADELCLCCQVCLAWTMECIDLCTPDSAARIPSESDSDYVQTPLPTQTRAFSRVVNHVRSGIKRRKSLRLQKLQAKKLAAAKTPQQKPKKSKKTRKKKSDSKKKQTPPKRQKTSACRNTKTSKKILTHNDLSGTPMATVTTVNAIPIVTATATLTATPSASATATFSMTATPSSAVAVPVANAYYAKSANVSNDTDFARFHRVLSKLCERISLNPDNNSLDVSACVCRNCPYSSGPLSTQRFMLMTRVHQVNQVLLHNPHLRDEFCL